MAGYLKLKKRFLGEGTQIGAIEKFNVNGKTLSKILSGKWYMGGKDRTAAVVRKSQPAPTAVKSLEERGTTHKKKKNGSDWQQQRWGLKDINVSEVMQFDLQFAPWSRVVVTASFSKDATTSSHLISSTWRPASHLILSSFYSYIPQDIVLQVYSSSSSFYGFKFYTSFCHRQQQNRIKF